jgi:hypothetical protein
VTGPIFYGDTPNANSAQAIIRGYLQKWNLEELYGDVDRLVKDGLDPETIMLRLQQTDSYKERFKANDVRIRNGLTALSPAEYLAAEASYKQVLRSNGLPAAFYDSRDDFAAFLGNDVSPEEVNARAEAAKNVWLSADGAVRNAWTQMYGLSDGAAIAAILDPDRALPIVQRMAAAAQIGGAARRNGLEVNASRFEQLADQGLDYSTALKGFGQIGESLGTMQGIAGRFGQTYSQRDAEQATFVGSASALRKQRELGQSETALFDAKAAADKTSLSRRTSGSY